MFFLKCAWHIITVITRKYSCFDTLHLKTRQPAIGKKVVSMNFFIYFFSDKLMKNFARQVEANLQLNLQSTESTVTESLYNLSSGLVANNSSLSLHQCSQLAPEARPITQSPPSQGVSSSSMEARRWVAIETRPNLPFAQHPDNVSWSWRKGVHSGISQGPFPPGAPWTITSEGGMSASVRASRLVFGVNQRTFQDLWGSNSSWNFLALPFSKISTVLNI